MFNFFLNGLQESNKRYNPRMILMMISHLNGFCCIINWFSLWGTLYYNYNIHSCDISEVIVLMKYIVLIYISTGILCGMEFLSTVSSPVWWIHRAPFRTNDWMTLWLLGQCRLLFVCAPMIKMTPYARLHKHGWAVIVTML